MKHINDELLAREKPVGHELPGSDGDSLVSHVCSTREAFFLFLGDEAQAGRQGMKERASEANTNYIC